MELAEKINTLAQWLAQSKYLVVFTGAGISTESGIRDFRGPDGLWTRRDKGLTTPEQDWLGVEPNAGHQAIAGLQSLGRLAFLISQNGMFVTHPEPRLIMRESIFSVAEAKQDPNLRGIGREEESLVADLLRDGLPDRQALVLVESSVAAEHPILATLERRGVASVPAPPSRGRGAVRSASGP